MKKASLPKISAARTVPRHGKRPRRFKDLTVFPCGTKKKKSQQKIALRRHNVIN